MNFVLILLKSKHSHYKVIINRYGSYVCAGYAEKSEESYYNSQMLIDPSGALISNYRKYNLYSDDHYWAIPGKGFKALDITLPKHGNKVVRIG
jgi:predicted amidohydrolase